MVVNAPSGLNVRSAPAVSPTNRIGGARLGQPVNVLGQAANGWLQIQAVNSDNGQLVTGFICNTCPEAPGGPWVGPGGANV